MDDKTNVQNQVKPNNPSKTTTKKQQRHQPPYQRFEESLNVDKKLLGGNSAKKEGTPINASTNLPISCESDANTTVTVNQTE